MLWLEVVQLGKLDDPNSSGLRGGVFTSQVGQFIGEILPGHGPQCGLFSDALRTFEDQAAIGLRPPGRKIRATAEMSQREPTAREYSVSSAPR